jgi:hypothetical protein
MARTELPAYHGRLIMRRTLCLATAGCLVALVPAGSAGSRDWSGEGQGVRAIAVTYADGRRTDSTIGERGRVSWTPVFPRVSGATTARDGLPLNALQFEEALDGQDLVVTLALLYGSPHQRRVPVATVRVTEDRPVRVDELEAFGVQPIVLSIVRLPLAQLHLPSVSSPSSQLDVQVDADSAGVPEYRFRIVNRSTQAVTSLAYRAYRGNTPSVSGHPRGPARTALIAPGETYTLRFPAAANGNRRTAADAWLPMDRFVITAVLWSDGLIEGDPAPAASERALDAGTANQLERAIALLRAAAAAPGSHPPGALRSDVAALAVDVTADEVAAARASLPDPTVLASDALRSAMRSGMQNVKNAVLNDLDEFTAVDHTARPAAYGEWLAAMVAKFDGWRQRITRPAA